MDWRMDTWSLSRWVSPFRDLRINGYLLLPEAYRSLSRLSSALGAKASALCSFLLGLSDAIALTSDGLLVFFLSLLSQCLVFVSILRLTYHQEMNVLHMRFSRYSFHMPAFNIQAGILCGKTNIFSFTASGDKEIRTLDPLLARQVLSQLSYIPIFCFFIVLDINSYPMGLSGPLLLCEHCPVGLSGLEPPTSRLSGVRSNQLSYKPFLIRQPPAFPCRLQHSIIGRFSLNRRVRDGYGCFPEAHRHRKSFVINFFPLITQQ